VEHKLKAFRVAALVSAVGGVAVLLSSGVSPAKAGEERLHSASFAVYGLIPLSENTKDRNTTRGTRAQKTNSVKSVSAPVGSNKPGPKGVASNEPKIEDPPLPTYDGPIAGGNTMASNEGGGQIGNN
jgi:hypothetical protein